MKKMIILIFLLIIVSSCSSHAKWKQDPINLKLMRWHFCEEKHGELSHKGLCYITRICKKRKLRSKKCKPKTLHCAWGDIPCMRKYKIFEKTIK